MRSPERARGGAGDVDPELGEEGRVPGQLSGRRTRAKAGEGWNGVVGRKGNGERGAVRVFTEWQNSNFAASQGQIYTLNSLILVFDSVYWRPDHFILKDVELT
jgi:hypothetical protein